MSKIRCIQKNNSNLYNYGNKITNNRKFNNVITNGIMNLKNALMF